MILIIASSPKDRRSQSSMQSINDALLEWDDVSECDDKVALLVSLAGRAMPRMQ